MKISKELFFEIKAFKEFDFNYVYDVENEKLEKGIEFFYFICKEWMIRNHFCIISGNGLLKNKGYFCQIDGFMPIDEKIFYADTEVQAIVKACQWILDNKKEQKC